MIGNVYTQSARESWATVPGRYFEPTYDANGNPITISYYDADGLVFVQYFTYDGNGNVIKCECKDS